MGLQVNTGMDARYSEYWLRSCFQEHAQQLRCEQLRGSTAVMRRHADSPSAEMVMLFLEQARHLPTSPHISPHLPTSPHASQRRPISLTFAVLRWSSPSSCARAQA